jgi:hypothetical protein
VRFNVVNGGKEERLFRLSRTQQEGSLSQGSNCLSVASNCRNWIQRTHNALARASFRVAFVATSASAADLHTPAETVDPGMGFVIFFSAFS